MSYTKKDYEKFVSLRDDCSLKGFDNFRRNIGRLQMSKFLEKFSKEEQVDMFAKNDKEHNIN